MKIISLNIWGGKIKESIDWIKKENADIYCLQEVPNSETKTIMNFKNMRANLFSEIKSALPNHIGFFAVEEENFEDKVDFGKAMFIRDDITIKETGDIFIYRNKNSRINEDNSTVGRSLQFADIVYKEKIITIAHLHGLWNGKGKTDTKERIEQSQKIKKFADTRENLLLMGDFNLLPDTESIRIVEEGMINLIKKYNIKTTRSKLYDKPTPWADYAFVKNIEIKEFNVPGISVSDHLPLITKI